MPRTPTAVAETVEEVTALVAAAINMTTALPEDRRVKVESWQTEAWNMYDATGELRYATSWFSNALSRAVLGVAKRNPDGVIEPVTSGPAVDALNEMLGGSDGQVAMLKAMGQHFFVPGEWYLVNRKARVEDEALDNADIWEVASIEEVKKTGKKWTLDYGDGVKIELGTGDNVIRMWTPHPRQRMLADSPVRAVLPNLRKMLKYGRHTDAQIDSRLTGAGLLLMPTEATFTTPKSATNAAPTNADSFMLTLGGTMMESIAQPGSPAAHVPIIVKMPGEYVDKVKHLNFWSELDQQVMAMTDAEIRRLALGLELPPEVLLGTADMNHWGAWQMDESAIKAHIEPALGIICAALTVRFLRPVTKDASFFVVYNTAALRMRPNRSREALELYDRGTINIETLIRETGFEESDIMDEEERKTWLLMKVASGSATPEMVNSALGLLGVDLGPIHDLQMNPARPDPSLQDHPENLPPEQKAAALFATCDALTFRALERAGNRLNNVAKARPPGVGADETHVYIPASPKDFDMLLAGAWSPLHRLLHNTGYDPELVEQALDAYCRSLLMSSRPHERTEMLRFLAGAIRGE